LKKLAVFAKHLIIFAKAEELGGFRDNFAKIKMFGQFSKGK
jgi:hypothetical protein